MSSERKNSSAPVGGGGGGGGGGMTLRQVKHFKPVDGQEPDVIMPDGGKYYGQVLSHSTEDLATSSNNNTMTSPSAAASSTTGGRSPTDPSSAAPLPHFISGVLKIPHGQGVLISPSGGVGDNSSGGSTGSGGSTKYGGEFKNGKMHGSGSIITEAFTYEGEWDDDKIHGFGTIHYKDGGGVAGAVVRGLTILSPFDHKVKPLEYRGEFHKTYHRHGKGTMTYRNGDMYEGEWVNNRRSGQGTYRSHEGDKYVGAWVDDEKSGEGTVSFPNGCVYHGTLQQDKRTGHGTLIFPNGDEYTGEFVDDQMEGHGSCKYRNGDKYEGQWRDGMRYGEGTFYLEKRGAIVRGRFAKGLLNGRGSVEFPGKSFFVGDFSKGERMHGVVWTEENDCYSGEWRSDNMHGKGIMWYGNGDFYYGSWLNSLRHGHGAMNFADGGEFAGEFVAGERNGCGIFKRSDGSIQSGAWKEGILQHGYDGEWDGHHFCGVGTLTFPNGDEYRGLFHNGLRHGAGSLTSQGGKMIYRGDWFNDVPHGRGS